MKNFAEEAELLHIGGGGIKLKCLNQLEEAITDLLNNEKKRNIIGNNAWELLNSKRGAIDKYVQKIITLIA